MEAHHSNELFVGRLHAANDANSATRTRAPWTTSQARRFLVAI